MYVYVLKFTNYPKLIKIGKSVQPQERAEHLSKRHGAIISSDFFEIGEDYHSVEKFLHKTFADKNSKDVRGDGCSEFFCDSVAPKVFEYLKKYKDLGFSDHELKSEEIRYHNLIGKLLGYSDSGLYTGFGSMFVGWHDIMKITSAISLGFSLEAVCDKFIMNGGDVCRNKRFTTPRRVAMALKLSEEGSSKYQTLQTSSIAHQKLMKIAEKTLLST